MAKKPIGMPKELIDAWDFRIRGDLSNRMATCDPTWEKHNKLVRNSEEGYRHGNLVADFLRVLQTRMFKRPWTTGVTADDPDYVSRAEDAAVVAESVSRIANITDNIYEATKDSAWATTGWLEVGHPLDPWSSDIVRSVLSPNVDQQKMIPSTSANIDDQYEEVPESELIAMGVDKSNVVPFDPFQELPGADGPEEPTPVFDAQMGYPWLTVVDPRYVIIPTRAKRLEHLDYRARLRFLTRAELKHLHGIDYGIGSGSMQGEARELFSRVEGVDPMLFPEMMCIVEVYINRDRNNPQFNNWYLSYVYQRPDWVIFNARNPYGGMIPLIPVKPVRHKGYYDTSIAKELSAFADMFDIGVKAMFRKFKRTLNEKYLTGGGAGLDPKAKANLLNDDFRGEIPVQDPNQVAKQKEEALDNSFLYYLKFTQSLAQMTSGASDIDRGTPIKDITASQSNAIIEATGINVEGMKGELGDSAREIVMKLMHLIGLYNQQGRTRKYIYGKDIVVMERGTHDFTASFIYNVEVTDTKDTNAEEQLAWNQFLRTLLLDSGGLMIPYLDPEELTKRTVRIMGQDPIILASRGGGREGQGIRQSADPQVQAALSGGGQDFSGAPGGGTLQDATMGQHPERAPGSRGVNLANAIQGIKRTGT